MIRKIFLILVMFSITSCVGTVDENEQHFVSILRKSGDTYIIEKYDMARRRVVPVSESEKMPTQRLISAFPSDYRMTYAWEENYPRFAGIDYKVFDEYASTIQNKNYAFVFREGADTSNFSGELYIVNKAQKTAHLLKSDAYKIQISQNLLFYLVFDGNDGGLVVYDLDTFGVVDKISDVLEIGFMPR